MKTIEERAEEFAEENWIGDDTVYAATDGYVTGAKETIEKLKEVLNICMIDTHDKERIIKLMEE